MSANDVDVANEALAKFGAGDIATFDDATALARAVKRVYWRVVLAIMSSYSWSFLRTNLQLVQLADPVMADNYLAPGWRYAYALPPYGPGGILAAPFAYLATPNRQNEEVHDFELQNGVVYCNETTLYADCLQAADPSQWPPYFRRAIVDCLAYELIMPVSGNSGLRDDLKAEAVGTPDEGGMGGSLGQARTADSRNDSSDTLGWASPLIDARWR
ncbi:MAG: hypothetical protein KGQ37_09455 [Hyphomicrobiales bacterium]|nr:hypothetical protein [Hyphomicrobiales bacterium]